MTLTFKDVPLDSDTKILTQKETTLGKYSVLYQKWAWEGIIAESFIFLNNDVSVMDDKELEKEVKKSPLVELGSQLTISRSDSGFTFVNFNFVS